MWITWVAALCSAAPSEYTEVAKQRPASAANRTVASSRMVRLLNTSMNSQPLDFAVLRDTVSRQGR